MSDKKAIGIAVVGYGYWSPRLIRNIQNLSSFNLVCICEKDESRHEMIKKQYPGVPVYRHYRDVFALPEVEAAVIATTPSSHFRIAKLALQSDKHVLVEKPMTLDVDDAFALSQLAKQNGRTLMVDHTYLYTPAIVALRELVRSGKLGKIYSIESIRVNLGLFQRDTNVVWDLAPHDFSILLSLLDEKPSHVSVSASKTVVHPKQPRPLESIAHIMLHYASGITAHVHVSWVSPVKVRQLTVTGSEQMAMYDQLAPQPLVLFDQGVYPTQDEGESGPLFAYKTGEATPVALPEGGEDLARMLKDFASAILDGKHPASTTELGVDVVRVLAAADKSLHAGGKKVSIRYKTGSRFMLLMRKRLRQSSS